MFTVLRYFGYYWLIATIPILVLFDWLLLERLPVGIEWLQLLLVAPARGTACSGRISARASRRRCCGP